MNYYGYCVGWVGFVLATITTIACGVQYGIRDLKLNQESLFIEFGKIVFAGALYVNWHLRTKL